MSQMMRARAYASIGNVGHGFDVFGMCVDAAYDEVEVSCGGGGLEIVVSGRGAEEIPTEPEMNTAGRAVLAVREKMKIDEPLRVRIIKGTRSGSGLGSSAASAAAAVVAVDRLLGLKLTQAELVLMAAEGERAAAGAAHTDNVAAAIYGGFVVFENDTPPRVQTVVPPVEMRVVLGLPAIRIRTKDARGVIPTSVSVADYSHGVARAGMTALALSRGELKRFGELIEGSIFETARAPLLPGFEKACAAARKAGAYGCVMSGAGPAVAAVTEEDRDTGAIAAAIRRAFVAAGVECETFVASSGPAAAIVEARS